MNDGSTSLCEVSRSWRPGPADAIRRDRPLLETVSALLWAVESHDPCTGDHAERVTNYALQLGRALGLTDADCLNLELGALLHDVGKIAVDDAVLRKPGRLTPDELVQMRAHPIQGYRLLQGIATLAPILPIVRSHHERWDGLGYPDGLADAAIPLLAQVVAVADAFDAMTSHRPYRPALAPAVAFARIADGAGTQFAPGIAAAFVRLRPAVAPGRAVGLSHRARIC